MEITVQHSKENPLLHRKEVQFVVKSVGATPSRKTVKEALAHQLKADAKLVVIDVLNQHFGSGAVDGSARVYHSEKDLVIEHKHKLNRDAGVKEEKKAKAKAAPAKKK